MARNYAFLLVPFWFCLYFQIAGVMAAPIKDINDPVVPAEVRPLKTQPQPVDSLRREPTQPRLIRATPREIPVDGNKWGRDPRLQGAVIQQARRALNGGNLEACRQLLEQAAEHDPALPPPGVLLAFLHLADGRLSDAWGALDKAASSDKSHPELYLTCGQLALLNGRRLDAAVHFEKALLLDKPSAWTDTHKRGFNLTCLAGLATISEQREDWASSVMALGKWAAADPTNAQVHERLGKALFLSGAKDEALDSFRASHEHDPSTNLPELSLAAMHVKMGAIAEAEQWYRKAKEEYPRDARPWFEYGAALLVADRVEESKAHIDKAVEIGAQLDSLGVDVPLMRGLLARRMNDYEAAEAHFTEVLKNSPGHVEALRQLPLVLIEQADDAKRQRAMRIARLLARRYPDQPQVASTLGWVYFRLDKREDAINTLLPALQNTPNAETLYFAAQVFLEEGNTREARQALKSLEAVIDQPGLFLLREEARQWLETTSLLFK